VCAPVVWVGFSEGRQGGYAGAGALHVRVVHDDVAKGLTGVQHLQAGAAHATLLLISCPRGCCASGICLDARCQFSGARRLHLTEVGGGHGPQLKGTLTH